MQPLRLLAGTHSFIVESNERIRPMSQWECGMDELAVTEDGLGWHFDYAAGTVYLPDGRKQEKIQNRGERQTEYSEEHGWE